MAVLPRCFVAMVCIVAGAPGTNAKGHHAGHSGHHYGGHHYGRSMAGASRSYHSSSGRTYYHGTTKFYVSVLGYHYLFGQRSFDQCGYQDECNAASPGCCSQEISASVLTIKANITVDPIEQLPAFKPAFVHSMVSRQIVDDVYLALHDGGVTTVPKELITVAALTYSSAVLRVLMPKGDVAAAHAALAGAPRAWASNAAPEYELGAATVTEASVVVTPDEDAMHKIMCELGVEQEGCEKYNLTPLCDGTPCQNGAGCFEGIRSYGCDCDEGWAGRSCQSAAAAVTCAAQPCGPHSVCNGAGNCVCRLGFVEQGGVCVDADECNLNPCENGGTCTDSTDSSRLQAAASKVLGGNTSHAASGYASTAPPPPPPVALGEFMCVCTEDWAGPRCHYPAPPVSGAVVMLIALLLIAGLCGLAFLHEWCLERKQARRYRESAPGNPGRAIGGGSATGTGARSHTTGSHQSRGIKYSSL